MTTKINGRTPEEIKTGIRCVAWDDVDCSECVYKLPEFEDCVQSAAVDALAYIQQLERERDAAVETVILLADEDCVIPCESDELACSEYCEKNCNFRTPPKECWMEYFRRRGVQEVE